MLRRVAWVGCGRRGSCARSKRPRHNTRATRCAGPAPVPPPPAQRRSSRATRLCRRAGAGVTRATPRAASMCGDPPVWASIKSRTSNFGWWCECNWAIGAAGSALPSHGRGRGFKSRIAHKINPRSNGGFFLPTHSPGPPMGTRWGQTFIVLRFWGLRTRKMKHGTPGVESDLPPKLNSWRHKGKQWRESFLPFWAF